ncbi:hypothetical protein NE237_009203 [Protea cynaroides]|uniref:Uncharacterized protein n=1 Tax=Protea cynaroides TaxID=273540 RepID=A0A9Q0KX49_9MAGN|nr:hypothetical protein NE237_009203 [Protea cynaroides]
MRDGRALLLRASCGQVWDGCWVQVVDRCGTVAGCELRISVGWLLGTSYRQVWDGCWARVEDRCRDGCWARVADRCGMATGRELRTGVGMAAAGVAVRCRLLRDLMEIAGAYTVVVLCTNYGRWSVAGQWRRAQEMGGCLMGLVASAYGWVWEKDKMEMAARFVQCFGVRFMIHGWKLSVATGMGNGDFPIGQLKCFLSKARVREWQAQKVGEERPQEKVLSAKEDKEVVVTSALKKVGNWMPLLRTPWGKAPLQESQQRLTMSRLKLKKRPRKAAAIAAQASTEVEVSMETKSARALRLTKNKGVKVDRPFAKFTLEWKLFVDDLVLANPSLVSKFSSKSILLRNVQAIRDMSDDVFMEQMHMYSMVKMGGSPRNSYKTVVEHNAELKRSLAGQSQSVFDTLARAEQLCTKIVEAEKEQSSVTEALEEAKG